MTWKEAEKIQVGAIVRESWSTHNEARQGLVLAKEYEEGTKREQVLCQERDKRYVLTVQWFMARTPTRDWGSERRRCSSWDLMLVSHTQ
jgi:hypothetical protein